jgi:hypothetical protein
MANFHSHNTAINVSSWASFSSTVGFANAQSFVISNFLSVNFPNLKTVKATNFSTNDETNKIAIIQAESQSIKLSSSMPIWPPIIFSHCAAFAAAFILSNKRAKLNNQLLLPPAVTPQFPL